MQNTAPTHRPSKTIVAEIKDSWEDPAKTYLWQLFHGDKYLAELIAQLEISARADFFRFGPESNIHSYVPANLDRIASLETLRRAVRADSDFQSAQDEFQPRYKELGDALDAEAIELAELHQKVLDLADQRAFAEAELSAKTANAAAPVEKIKADVAAIAIRIQELTDPGFVRPESPPTPPAPLTRGKVKLPAESNDLAADFH